MTKSELVRQLKDKFANLQLKEAANIVDIFFDLMADRLMKNGRVEIRGFGTFSIRERKARKARNPKTGEQVLVDDRKVVYFRAGKGLKDKVNN